ncbi:MAG: hypothetical protein Q8Q40_07840 [Methylococcaceae bacterium]|nr:hypothetical protein [Methylococcaceae bacterium]
MICYFLRHILVSIKVRGSSHEPSSQAVRLPAAFQFDTKEVFIRKDSLTGDVILSRKPGNWDDFFSALKGSDAPCVRIVVASNF